MGEVDRKNKLKNELVFLSKKLPLPKLEEALDYIKWLWLSPERKKNEEKEKAVNVCREIQAKHKAYSTWDSVKEIRKWRTAS